MAQNNNQEINNQEQEIWVPVPDEPVPWFANNIIIYSI